LKVNLQDETERKNEKREKVGEKKLLYDDHFQ
jgi:hypothetical protein